MTTMDRSQATMDRHSGSEGDTELLNNRTLPIDVTATVAQVTGINRQLPVDGLWSMPYPGGRCSGNSRTIDNQITII
jgi:hypothetical protein